MVYLATCVGYNSDNKFELKEIYVGTETNTYVLSKNFGYAPQVYSVGVVEIVDSVSSMIMFNFGMSKIRYINDRDEKSLAQYIKQKLDLVDMDNPVAEKTLFDVLSNFGREYVRHE